MYLNVALEGDIIFIILDSKQTCFCSGGRHHLYLPKLFSIHASSKRQFVTKASSVCIHRRSMKNCLPTMTLGRSTLFLWIWTRKHVALIAAGSDFVTIRAASLRQADMMESMLWEQQTNGTRALTESCLKLILAMEFSTIWIFLTKSACIDISVIWNQKHSYR